MSKFASFSAVERRVLYICFISHSLHFVGNMKDLGTFLVCGITSSQLPDEFHLQISQVDHLVSFYVEFIMKQ